MPHEITNTSKKESLKQNDFITTSPSGLAWASENRKSIVVTTSLLLLVILIIVGVGVFAHSRSVAAQSAFGSAMEIYQAPVDIAGQPKTPGVTSYASVADRAKAANAAFGQVADKYGMTEEGKNARYFQGVTFLEEGQTQSAESTLKTVADSWNKELASLAKLALADLYHQTGRDAQAIDLYNEMTAKPTDAVPAGLAQMELAGLYTSQGKIDQAHKIYAQLKDKDPKSTVGLAAAKKLNPNATAEPQM